MGRSYLTDIADAAAALATTITEERIIPNMGDLQRNNGIKVERI